MNNSQLWISVFRTQDKPRFGWPERFALAGYCIVLYRCVSHHASWFDEAQAWLIARDSTLRGLLLHRLHYEGAPAFWYLLLWIEIHSHVSFLGMRLIAGAIAAAGVFVWLRYNSLPRILSLAIPFSFFLLYQYAVIARSYVLFPLLAFTLMAMRRGRNVNPWLFALVAGLMANCSAHMAAFAAGMVLWYGWDRWKTAGWRRLTGPALLFAASLGVAAAVAWPTPDLNFGRENPMIQLLSHGRRNPVPAAADPIATTTLPPAKLPPVVRLMVRLLTVITAPISTVNLLTLLFLAWLGICLYRHQVWICLLPALMVVLFFVTVDGASHHTGIVWIGLLCCLWELASTQTPHVSGKWLRPALYAVTSLVVALQIRWTVYAVRNDFFGAYSGYRAAGEYLRELPAGTRVASFDLSGITVNVNFPHTPYFNARTDYWPFSETLDPSVDFDHVIAERPDVVVAQEQDYVTQIQNQWIAIKKPGPTADDLAMARRLVEHGYHETHRFCGNHVFRNATEFEDCGVIYEPANRAGNENATSRNRESAMLAPPFRSPSR